MINGLSSTKRTFQFESVLPEIGEFKQTNQKFSAIYIICIRYQKLFKIILPKLITNIAQYYVNIFEKPLFNLY